MFQSSRSGTTTPSLGDSIGRYRLIAELARGGMGIVYVAASQGPGGFSKLVALKELKPELAEDTDFLAMFLDEARIAARLNHPNIVQTNDVDVHDGRHFIAMEYLEGRSLQHVQKRFLPKGGLPQRVVLTVLRDVLAALDYAHELSDADGRLLGFVHRDISPHNLFLTFDGHSKVIDFGIAKARDSSLETKTGVLKGRVTYMAPEQLAHAADRRSDLFSVGVILAEAVMGHRLWQGLNDMEVLSRLVRNEIPPVNAPGVPAQLLELCRKALQPRADDRYQTAALMRDAVDEYLWTQGGSPKPREISAVLMREFEAERKRRRELVEAALQRLSAGEGGRLTTLAAPDGREAESETHRPSVSPIASIARRRASVVTALPPPPPLHDEPALLMTLPDDEVRAIALGPARAQGRWIYAAAGGLVLLGVVAALLLPRAAPPPPEDPLLSSKREAPVVAAPLVRQIAAPAQNPAPATIVLSVGVAPAGAQLTIDDQPVPSNPFVGRFPRGAEWHRVRATAPGYQTRERLVSFEDNVMIDLTLPPRAPTLPPPRHESSHHADLRRADPPPPFQRRADPPPPVRPAPLEAAAPPAAALAPARATAADISPRSPADPPRRRAIDATNPYGDEP
jgi:eukaryotic-like serine/threonine-protein kinase